MLPPATSGQTRTNNRLQGYIVISLKSKINASCTRQVPKNKKDMGVSQIQKPKYYASVLPNFILVAVVIGFFVTKDSENTTKFSIINANGTNRASALESHNAAASYKKFLATGLSEEHAKVLVLHCLHSGLNHSLSKPGVRVQYL